MRVRLMLSWGTLLSSSGPFVFPQGPGLKVRKENFTLRHDVFQHSPPVIEIDLYFKVTAYNFRATELHRSSQFLTFDVDSMTSFTGDIYPKKVLNISRWLSPG